MLMRAELQVFDAKGAPVHGDYSLDWVSPSKWREEIRFGKYERLRVGDANGYWQTNGLSYQPEIIFQLDTMLHIKDAIRVRSKQSLGKVKNRGKAGLRQKCTEVKWTRVTERIMCFDEANGALVSIEYPRGENQNSPEISRIEYGAFNVVSGKLVPYEIRALTDGKDIAALKVLEITKITQENPALFNVPVNAEHWAQCDDLQEAEPVARIQPSYPPGAPANHEQGRVILYAVLEADGSLSHKAEDRPPELENITRTFDQSLAQDVALVAQQPLDFTPGSKWTYSSSSIAVLGRVIEVISGQPFESFMEKQVFEPLVMRDSSFFTNRSKVDRLPTMYNLEDGKLVKDVMDVT